MAALYTATILAGAFLLFLVEPMFARMLLPRLGGSPEVWNTAVVFYQVVLLLGYLYVHVGASLLGMRRQAALHVVLLAVAFLFLPVGVPADLLPPAATSPAGWMLIVLVRRLGLPFFVLSATSPLIQRWFASLPHPAAKDPYFLYAASNVGSLLGLVVYPFLVEPNLRLVEQSGLWTGGYAVFAVLIAASALVLRYRGERTVTSGRPSPVLGGAGIRWARRMRWLMVAAVPSSLMLSVTTYLSTDMPALPLMWIVPLALYLLTFVLAFSARRLSSGRALSRLLVPLVLTIPLGTSLAGRIPVWFAIPMHLAGFFVAALACHRWLAEDRPAPDGLTEFYLWLSAGGALGGAFNTLVAPQVFSVPLEYPLGLAAAATILARLDGATAVRPWGRVAIAGALCGAALVIGLYAHQQSVEIATVAAALAFGLPFLFAIGGIQRRGTLAAGGLLCFAVSFFWAGTQADVVRVERGFFGVNRVHRDASAGFVRLYHGTTLHGMQSLAPERACEPLTYYHPTGPVGQLLSARSAGDQALTVGVVGLGAGSLAAYMGPEDDLTFYEIDPEVERIARDPACFSFLSACAPETKVVLGDGRLSLAEEPAGRFDVLVLDAYSSDSLPVHLLTREAVTLYLEKLAPGGVLAFHISNRYFDLSPVFAAHASEQGLSGLVRLDGAATEEAERGKTSSEWLLLARDAEDLSMVASDPSWQPLDLATQTRVWTDDFSSPLLVLKR